MSLLMFTLGREGAWIVTDTLATTPDGAPHLLVSKCHLAPQLELAVAVTGIANVGDAWTQSVQSQILARDIDMLNLHAPDALRGICTELEVPEDTTTTIYHIGFSLTETAYVGYVYRSKNDFESEAMHPSFRVKPDPPVDVAFEPPGTVDEIIALAETIRANEDVKPSNERIYIGGELVMTTLVSNVISSTKIHKFVDFEQTWSAMNQNLNRGVEE